MTNMTVVRKFTVKHRIKVFYDTTGYAENVYLIKNKNRDILVKDILHEIFNYFNDIAILDKNGIKGYYN